MHVLSGRIHLVIALLLLPVQTAADDADLRDALKLGASTTLSADITAHEAALGNVMDGFGHVNLYGNGLYLASRSRESMARGWAALSVREYHDDPSGVASRLMMGYDFPLLQHSRLGFSAGFAKANLDTGREIESRSFSFGPYLKTRIGDKLKLKSWMNVAQPVYRYSGGSTRAMRVGGGTNATLSDRIGGIKMSSSAALSMSHQFTPSAGSLDGFEISNLYSSISARATLNPDGHFKPYFDVGVTQGYWRNDSSFGDYSTPRFATGFQWSHKKRSLTLQIDGSHVFDPTLPVALTSNFRLSF
jgi:opacity protein-like surface antigen